MNDRVKIVLYGLLLVAALGFGVGFYRNYNRLMRDSKVVDEELMDPKIPVQKGTPAGMHGYSRMLLYGIAFFFSVLTAGLMAGHDLSHLIGEKVGKVLFNDEGETIRKSSYEEAEELWANGEHLEAIQLMRDHLRKNPQEQHVALRIAEIYEKDLSNPLAAALEYEEVLKKKLAAEQWGWTAIHLCNLYSTKLSKPDKAMALLRRIVTEFGDTEAAVKARKRLDLPEPSRTATTPNEPAPDPASPPSTKTTPPRPDNSDLLKHFDRFHQRNQNPPET